MEMSQRNFINHMQSKFGLDEESASNLYKVYYGMYNPITNSDAADYANLMFAQSIAGCSYKGVPWGFFSGQYGVFENSVDYFMIYGELSREEAEKLCENIKKQHVETSGNGEKIDMSHMFYTLSAYLYDNDLVGGIVSNICTGYSDEITSGFGGDVFGIKCLWYDKAPAMGNDDYWADLDAVNLYRRLMKGNNETIIDVFNNYYNSLDRNEINRANEFLANMGGKEKFFELMRNALESGRSITLAWNFY